MRRVAPALALILVWNAVAWDSRPVCAREITDDAKAKATAVIREELARAAEQLSPAEAAVLRGSVLDLIAQTSISHRELSMLAATMRFISAQNSWAEAPFNPVVRTQITALSEMLLQQLNAGAFGEIPLAPAEQSLAACDWPALDWRDCPALTPSFRRALSPADLDWLRNSISEYISFLEDNRSRLLLYAPDLMTSERKLLWRAFIRQSVRDAILKPIMNRDKQAIQELVVRLFSDQLPHDSLAASPLLPAPSSADSPVQSSIDIATEAAERNLAVFLSILPVLLQQAPLRQPALYDLGVNIATSYDPFTQIRWRCRLLTLPRWTALIMADVEANDGNLFDETAYRDLVFVYDHQAKKLSRYDEAAGTLTHLFGPTGRPRLLHLEHNFDYSDLWSIFAWANSLLQRDIAGQGAQAEDFPGLLGLPCVPHKGEAPREAAIPASIAVAFDNRNQVQRLFLPTIRPDIVLGFVPVGNSAANFTVRLGPSLLPQGARIDIGRVPTAEKTYDAETLLGTIYAPSRFYCRTTLARLTTVKATVNNEADLLQFLRSACHTEPSRRAKDIVKRALETICSGTPTQIDPLLEEMRLVPWADLSANCAFALRDAKIGLLNRMGKTAEIKEEYRQQCVLLESTRDHAMAEDYRAFYRRLFESTQNAHLAARPCYSAFEAPAVSMTAPIPAHPPTKLSDLTIPSTRPRDNDGDLKTTLQDVIAGCQMDERRKQTALALMQALWTDFPQLQRVDAATLATIKKEWLNALGAPGYWQGDDQGFLSQVNTRRWQTYHCARLSRFCLTDSAQDAKGQQATTLCQLLRKMEANIETAVTLRPSVSRALAEATADAIRQLRDAMDNPFNPHCYYPLPDESFQSVVNAVEQRIHDEVGSYKAYCGAKHEVVLADAIRAAALGGTVVFLDHEFCAWEESRAKVVMAHVLGKIFYEYCVGERHWDFDDPQWFPFCVPAMIFVAHRQAAGLDITLIPDYREVLYPPAE